MTDLPSGAVTFLFTDIEGSTKLVKQLRARYGDVLREHQRLLRAAFEAHGGHEVDTQGDSFFVAFAHARDALLAAVEGQRALVDHPWPEGVQLKVRMGLHTGQAVASGDRYTGLAVHRAARIGGAGHGGQILVSQATQTLLEDEEENLHVFLQDLGDQRLKDLDRPVRLYQAVADGLPVDFPPPRSGVEPAGDEAARPAPFWRRPWLLGAAALVVAGVAAGAIAAFRPSGGSAVTVAPNSVAAVDPEANRVVDTIPVGTRPGPIAFGDGSVWVGNDLDDRSVTRIDPARRTVILNIPLEGRTPTGLAFGFGSLWVAHGLRGQVSRIEPEFNQVLPPIDVADTFFGSPNGSVATDRTSVWAVFNDSTLARLAPTTARVLESTRAGTQPAGIASGFGSIWVSNSGDATVTRYNPRTFTEGPLHTISVGARPTGIAAGAGAVWVTNTADGTVYRIDPNSQATAPIAVGDSPTAVAVGADAVWVANRGSGTVTRIDPTTNEVERTIEIGNAPAGIVVAGGLVWVAVQAP